MQKIDRRKFLTQAGLASAVGLITTGIVTQSVSAGPVITIGIDVGRKKYGCERFGICGITIGLELSAKSVPGTAQIEGNSLLLKFNRPLRTRETAIPIDEAIVLSPALSKALGVRAATVLAGEYKFSPERNGATTRLSIKQG